MQVNEDDDYSDLSPGAAIDTTGRVWFVWGGIDPVEEDEEIYFRYWEDGAWGPQGMVNPPNRMPDRFPELCSGKQDGVPWCIWAGWDTLAGAYDFLVSRWVGDSWSWPETVFVGGGRYDAYDIVARDTSLVWALWSTRTTVAPTHKDIFARARVDGVWGEAEQIELTYGHEGEPRGDLDSQNRLWVVWHSDSLDKVVIQSCVRDESGWGQVLHVAGDSMGCYVPWIALDDGGTAWVVWDRGDPLGGSDIWSARWSGSGWEHLGKVSESGGTGEVGFGTPVIESVKGSGPLVVWWGGPYLARETKDIYESKWTAYGWREQACVSTPDSVYLASDGYPRLAVGPDGAAWVCWGREQATYPYDLDVLCRYSSDVTPVYGLVELRGEVRDGLVVLSWSVDYLGRFRVYRSRGAASRIGADSGFIAVDCDSVGSVLPESAQRLTENPVVRSGRVEYADDGIKSSSTYTYWVVEERVGVCYVASPVSVDVPEVEFAWLRSVYPNPFVSGGWILWEGAGDTVVEVYDVGGRLVRQFEPEEAMALGFGGKLVYWDCRGTDGRMVASGVYVVRLASNGMAISGARKVVVIR